MVELIYPTCMAIPNINSSFLRRNDILLYYTKNHKLYSFPDLFVVIASFASLSTVQRQGIYKFADYMIIWTVSNII